MPQRHRHMYFIRVKVINFVESDGQSSDDVISYDEAEPTPQPSPQSETTDQDNAEELHTIHYLLRRKNLGTRREDTAQQYNLSDFTKKEYNKNKLQTNKRTTNQNTVRQLARREDSLCSRPLHS
ncbi:hypothetical protein E2C01_078747 [Portunus trituberculatus]|uniref:Uncharacterized protein n=1 Tax=Portunus trituberculatus TaxID=210409 RepID=A0A5B7INM8_PORTR|nr:hypothetical protein [Portunus trituberculatus]